MILIPQWYTVQSTTIIYHSNTTRYSSKYVRKLGSYEGYIINYYIVTTTTTTTTTIMLYQGLNIRILKIDK